MDIAELYARYSGLVLRRVGRFYPRGEAEEVVHEVFVRVMENADSFRGEASPASWLYRVTTNHCLNRRSREARRRELWIERGADPVAAPPDQESITLLRELWRELDPELVELATYYYVDGMTQGDIAELLGCARSSVGGRLEELRRRAREHAA